MQTFDCVVVGAGPAGAAALRELALAGVRACAVDKACFPRYKPCGGAISALTARELEFDWSDLIEASLHRVELAFRHTRPLVCESDRPFAHFVMRDRFDARLLEQAIAAGGAFFPERNVRRVTVDQSGVEVQTERERFRAQIAIGADGANGCTAGSIGLFQRDRGIAIEAEVDAPPRAMAPYQDTVYLSYADPPWGYGWIFPKKDRLSVGVGTFSRHRKGLKDAFARLLDRKGLADFPMAVYGHPIPTGGKNSAFSSYRVMLTGDAAGLNDPLSGEGIAHAVKSGKIAARHAIEALETGDFAFERYDRDIDRTIAADLRLAASIAQKLYAFPRLFHWLFARSPGTMELYFRLVRGEVSYTEVADHLKGVYSRFGLFAETAR